MRYSFDEDIFADVLPFIFFFCSASTGEGGCACGGVVDVCPTLRSCNYNEPVLFLFPHKAFFFFFASPSSRRFSHQEPLLVVCLRDDDSAQESTFICCLSPTTASRLNFRSALSLCPPLINTFAFFFLSSFFVTEVFITHLCRDLCVLSACIENTHLNTNNKGTKQSEDN